MVVVEGVFVYVDKVVYIGYWNIDDLSDGGIDEG